ncbi:MAG: Lung surfactant protein A [Candidatus Jorgensenbacteria bacterium GW2011_GWB1_50_10]|uniref:Lung surfactant protein A n=1 Tax=Candidatus Jorgensenbacteria bacterium GW2011_GWB1_50_10 TaxID=1618665 RepID=A0A0G1W7J7_9BACT|nr:MAG: Lung surfactant protein A [Candidatus Jorgensenbacteria bacterium GW2011_GWB1_50_10]
MMVIQWLSVARTFRLYIQPIVLGAVFFVAAIAIYATVWNLIIMYNVFPSTPVSASGMVTVTTFLLTTSTFITNQTTTTEATTTKISNQTTTTVLNETVTATRCPAGVTSCAGTGESVVVVVNRPIINTPNFKLGQMPIYVSSMNPPSLNFYHETFYSAVAIICTVYTVTSILSNQKKMKLQQRRFAR